MWRPLFLVSFFFVRKCAAASARQQECACLGPAAVPADFFKRTGYSPKYGASCSDWDLYTDVCRDGTMDDETCAAQWCYVPSHCIGARPTTIFMNRDGGKDLYFSYEQCGLMVPRERRLARDVELDYSNIHEGEQLIPDYKCSQFCFNNRRIEEDEEPDGFVLLSGLGCKSVNYYLSLSAAKRDCQKLPNCRGVHMPGCRTGDDIKYEVMGLCMSEPLCCSSECTWIKKNMTPDFEDPTDLDDIPTDTDLGNDTNGTNLTLIVEFQPVSVEENETFLEQF